MRETQRRLAAVWFADLVDYTRLAAEDEDAALELVDDMQTVARQVVERHAGRIVKFVGDAVLAEFASVHEGMRSALALPVELSRRRAEAGRGSRPVRVGLHVGELATTPDGDVLGDGVNVAARIQSIAGPDQVVCSEDVARYLRKRAEFGFDDLGERSLKGLGEPVRLFAVRPVADSGSPGFAPATRAAPAPPHSIAVLPFANLSADPENEYFSDGVTEEILTALARVGDLKVISRTSVMSYKGTSKSLRLIGDELGVATILEGSVRRAGARVRITAQLIDARTDQHLWAERYDRDLEDIFAIQADVAEQIVGALRVHLTPRERAQLQETPKISQTAHEAYLKGLWYWNRRNPANLRRAESWFEDAAEAEPGYARAHAGRACACVLQLHWGSDADPTARDRAFAEAERAIELDPDVSEGYAARAQVRIYDRDWPGAERDFRRAIGLNPGDATARQWYAEYLACMGRFDEAFEQVERARELDPLSLAVLTEAGNVLVYARRYEEAERRYREALELDPTFAVARFKLMELYQLLGRYDEALTELGQVGPSQAEAAARLREEMAASGVEGYLESRRRFSDAIGGLDAFYDAAVLAGFGRLNEALAELERAFEEGNWYLIRTAVIPHFDPLRADPRFADLLKRLGLDHVRPAIAPEPTAAAPDREV
ncbi:MAG: adenylate/guanylate cyclase domain-containing protein [Gemmatimonadota bacterium]